MTMEELAESVAELPKETFDKLMTTQFATMDDIADVVRKDEIDGKFIPVEKEVDFASKDYVGRKITENNLETGNKQPSSYIGVNDLEFT